MRKIYVLLSLLAGMFVFQAVSSCGSSSTTPATTTATTSTLIGEWTGDNSTNNCLASTDACAKTKFTVTFTADKTYSIVSNDGGSLTGTYTYTTSVITTVVSTAPAGKGTGCTLSYTATAGVLSAPVVVLGGSGYTVGDYLAVADGTKGYVTVLTVNATGAVLTAKMSAGGSGYTTVVMPVAAGKGTGCTLGYTATAGVLSAPVVVLGGTGYAVGDYLAVADGTKGFVTVVTVDSSGAVLTVKVSSGGSGYTTTATPGSATTETATGSAAGSATTETAIPGLKTSACFTYDFLNGNTYTLSADGKTMTIPVCPITLTKK